MGMMPKEMVSVIAGRVQRRRIKQLEALCRTLAEALFMSDKFIKLQTRGMERPAILDKTVKSALEAKKNLLGE